MLRAVLLSLLTLSTAAHAVPVEFHVGELAYGSRYSGGAATSRAPFEHDYFFTVPDDAREFVLRVTNGTPVAPVHEFRLWKGSTLLKEVIRRSSYVYFGIDPLQSSYTHDYVASIAGDYLLNVKGERNFVTSRSFYNLEIYANQNRYIPDAPVPAPGPLLLVGTGLLLGYYRRRRQTRQAHHVVGEFKQI